MGVDNLLSGRYLVHKKIGQGGMQEVFLADDKVIGNQVAVKTPLKNSTKRRFKQSAKLAARINNHGVARTLDYFEIDDVAYLVEELVVGDTLDKAILNFAGYIDPYFATRLFGILAKGIAASHRADVVHRDLKPSNIMISGGFGLKAVKITDFGIATLAKEVMDEEVAGDITKSTSGTVKGAIPYMAPEMMFRQAGQSVESPADIWSFGAMMFYALTGILPFGEGFLAPVAVANGTRQPWPSFMTSDSQFKSLSLELQKIAESCLVNDPLARPSADEIVDRIRSLCVFNSELSEGIIEAMPERYYGFLRTEGGKKAMFHKDSVYGPNRPKVGLNAVFATSAGVPKERAYPMLVQKQSGV